MKKYFIVLLSLYFLVSCKSTSAVDTNINYEAQKKVKGNWVLTNVAYDNSNYIQINLFEQASSDCFINSKWSFVSNNNKGTVMFPNGCAVNKNITWYINNDGQMVLKFLDSESSRKTNTGYVVDYIYVNDNTFILRNKTMISSNPVAINLTFARQ